MDSTENGRGQEKSNLKFFRISQ